MRYKLVYMPVSYNNLDDKRIMSYLNEFCAQFHTNIFDADISFWDRLDSDALKELKNITQWKGTLGQLIRRIKSIKLGSTKITNRELKNLKKITYIHLKEHRLDFSEIYQEYCNKCPYFLKSVMENFERMKRDNSTVTLARPQF